jgi:hypothetical protein
VSGTPWKQSVIGISLVAAGLAVPGAVGQVGAASAATQPVAPPRADTTVKGAEKIQKAYDGADACISLSAKEADRRALALEKAGLADGKAVARLITSGVSAAKKSKREWEWSIRARGEVKYPLPRSSSNRWHILVEQGYSCTVQIESSAGPDSAPTYWRVLQAAWGRPATATRSALPKLDDEKDPVQRRVIEALELKAATSWCENLPSASLPRVTVYAEDTGVLELRLIRAKAPNAGSDRAEIECSYVRSAAFVDPAAFLARFQPLWDAKLKREQMESAVAEKARRGPDETDLKALEDRLLRVEQEIAEFDSILDRPHEDWARQEYVRKRDAKRQQRIELLQKIDDAKRHIGKK